MQVVWGEHQNIRNTELCFVCNIEKQKNVTLSLIAKDVYNLYVNGRFVSYGPARAAKGYARVDRILLDEFLTKQVNVVEIYVEYYGTRTLCFAGGDPFFGCEVVGENCRVLVESKNFQCYLMTDKIRKVERMSSQRGYLEVYALSANRSPFCNGCEKINLVDASIPKILERNVAYSKYEKVVAKQYEQGSVGINLQKTWDNDFTKMLENGNGLFSYTRSECDCVLSKELLAFDFTMNGRYNYRSFVFQNIECGKLALSLNAESNCDVWVVYDDILVDGKIQFNREQITHGLKWSLEKGDYTLYSQEVYSAKYVTLIFCGAVEVDDVSIIRVENPEDCKKFECDDADLQEVYLAAARTFRHNCYDLPTDCPNRERAGYLCDGYFLGIAEHFFTDSSNVERNFLENYRHYQNEIFNDDGILPMCYPSVASNKDDYIPNWILWFVLQLREFEKRTGDSQFVATFEDKVRKALKFFARYENEFGLLEKLDGWVFIEWSKANDFVDGVNYPSNMLYSAALRAAGEMFDDFSLKNKAEAVRRCIVNQSFDGKLFHDNAVRKDGKLVVTDNVSETCQNYAIFFDIADKEHKTFVEEFVKRFDGCHLCPSNMFIGYILRLFGLFKNEKYQQVIDECEQMFLPMAKRTGTIWELFAENASCNHGFGAVVGYLVCESYKRCTGGKND